MKRRSINVEGFNHGQQPIPAASRVGPLIVTGGIHGMDPATQKLPDGSEDQARFMFANLVRILAAGGGTPDAIVRITVHVKSQDSRAAVNAEWLKLFPDEASRPARHTLINQNLPGNMLVQCDAIAFVTPEEVE